MRDSVRRARRERPVRPRRADGGERRPRGRRRAGARFVERHHEPPGTATATASQPRAPSHLPARLEPRPCARACTRLLGHSAPRRPAACASAAGARIRRLGGSAYGSSEDGLSETYARSVAHDPEPPEPRPRSQPRAPSPELESSRPVRPSVNEEACDPNGRVRAPAPLPVRALEPRRAHQGPGRRDHFRTVARRSYCMALPARDTRRPRRFLSSGRE